MKWGQVREEHGGPDTWRPNISIGRNWGSGKDFVWRALEEKGQADTFEEAQETVDRVVERHYATAAARSQHDVSELKRRRLVSAGEAYEEASRVVAAAENVKHESSSALGQAGIAHRAAEKEQARCLVLWEKEKGAKAAF